MLIKIRQVQIVIRQIQIKIRQLQIMIKQIQKDKGQNTDHQATSYR